MERLVACVVLLALAHPPTTLLAACSGDCGGDSEVTVNEIIQGVNIALGTAPLSQCISFDTNGDGEVTVNELVSAVNAALTGCPTTQGTPTPTPTQGVATPTAVILPQGISSQMLGTWSGRAVDTAAGISKPVRLRIAIVSNAVFVTDLIGDLFASGRSIGVMVPAPTSLVAANTIGNSPGGYAETLQLTLGADGDLGGTYSTTTLSRPPSINSRALILSKEF